MNRKKTKGKTAETRAKPKVAAKKPALGKKLESRKTKTKLSGFTK